MSQVLPTPAAVRVTLPSFAFLSWNGLFTSPPTLGPMLTGIAVSLAWAVTATALAYLLFVRRDFTTLAHDGSVRRAITLGILPLLGVWVLSAGVVAAATGATGSGIDAGKLQRSLATSFAHLYRVQSQEVSHLNLAEAQLRAAASCTKGLTWSPRTVRETTGAATSTGTCPVSMTRPDRPAPTRSGRP